MSKPQYWRVNVKGCHYPHLTRFVEGQGSGTIALCGKPLPDDSRKQPAPRTVPKPLGDECRVCLRKCPDFQLARNLKDLGLSNPEITKFMELLGAFDPLSR
jgi:hypothetical protein